MNFLILVFSFLVILGLQSHYILQQAKESDLARTAYLSLAKIERHLQAKWIQKQYQQIPKIPEASSPDSTSSQSISTKKPSSSPKKAQHSTRESIPPLKYGKIYLKTLFSSDAPLLLRKICSRCIDYLYQQASFYRGSSLSSVSSALIEEWIQKNKKKPIETFKDLLPDKEPLRTIFYRMLRGTPHYDLGKKEGYPPFNHFFSLDESDKSFFYFNQVHPILLLALFDQPSIVQAILAKEQEKRKEGKGTSLSQDELSLLLSDCHFSAWNLSELSPYIQFQTKPRRHCTLSCRDKALKITLEKKILPSE